MANVHFPIGSSQLASVDGQDPIQFVNFGNPTGTGQEAYSVTNRRLQILVDSTQPESVEILTQPEHGRVIARSDGRISYDLNDSDALVDQTFSYRRTNGGTTEDVTATVTLTQSERPAGWGIGDYFYIETDANDAFVVQPGETVRVLHVANDGLSEADILARHAGAPDQLNRSNVRARDLQEVAARDAAGQIITPPVLYGETEALALQPAEASKLYQFRFGTTVFDSWWVLYKRGQTYAEAVNTGKTFGESRLHPTYVGTFGTGDAPYFTGSLFEKGTSATFNAVFQDFDYGDRILTRNCSNYAFDRVTCDGQGFPASASARYPIGGGGIDQDGMLNRNNTFRRYKATDIVPTIPTGGKTHWSRTNNDRISGFYVDDSAGILIEKVFVDQVAWSHGYRSDQIGTFPKSPDDGSHGFYLQADVIDVTVRDIIITNPSFNGIQMRGGGVMQRAFVAYANAGILFGNGESQVQETGPTIAGEERRTTTLSYGSDLVITEAGEKDGWDSSRANPSDGFLAVLAGGFEAQNWDSAIQRVTVINGGERGQPISSAPELGPVGRVSRPSETYAVRLAAVDVATGEGASWFGGAPDAVTYNWSPSYLPNSDTTGMDTALLDTLSTGGYNDQWKGVSGSDLSDLVTSLRAESAPWEQITGLLDYYQTPTLQRLTAQRSAATTVQFEPDASGRTPGMRADIMDDWATKDLPGTYAGDSIDLGGYRVYWNISPDHACQDLRFGSGGSLWMRGGNLTLTGTITCNPEGDVINVRGGARLKAASVSGGKLTVLVNDGRYHNTGTVTGGLCVKVVCDSEAILAEPGGSFTAGAGDVVTIGGYAKAGGDGIDGGTGTITFEPGSKLRFQVGARISCKNETGGMAVPYGMIQGSSSGATATIEDHYRTNGSSGGNARFAYKAYDLTGAFVNNDALTASEARANGVALTGNNPANTAGVVDGAPATTLGQLRTFRSGVHGLTPPNMTLTLAMGGTLEIDMTGHPGAMTHTLVAVDALSGAFDTISVLGLGTRDATLTIGSQTITLDVTAPGTGTGQVAVF